MKNIMCRILIVMSMNCTILFLSVPLQSQSIWQIPIEKDRLDVEILKSNFDDLETSTITSVLFLTYHHAISQNLKVVAELPFAHIGFKRSNRSETSIGNPYVGLEIHHKAIPLFIELGMRAKLAPEELDDSFPAAFMAFFTEIVDRGEAFAESTFPIVGVFNFYSRNASGYFLRIRSGLAYWFIDVPSIENQQFLLYSVQAGYENDKFSFMGGFSGRRSLNFDEQHDEVQDFYQVGITANYRFSRVSPGIYYRIPLYDQERHDEWPKINSVIGLNFSFLLR